MRGFLYCRHRCTTRRSPAFAPPRNARPPSAAQGRGRSAAAGSRRSPAPGSLLERREGGEGTGEGRGRQWAAGRAKPLLRPIFAPSRSARRPTTWPRRPVPLSRLTAIAITWRVGNLPAQDHNPARLIGNRCSRVPQPPQYNFFHSKSATRRHTPPVAPPPRPAVSQLRSGDPPASATRPARVSPSCAWQQAMLNSAAERSPSEMSRGLSLRGGAAGGRGRSREERCWRVAAHPTGRGEDRMRGAVSVGAGLPACQCSCWKTSSMYMPTAMGRGRVAQNLALLRNGQRRRRTRPRPHHRPSAAGQATVRQPPRAAARASPWARSPGPQLPWWTPRRGTVQSGTHLYRLSPVPGSVSAFSYTCSASCHLGCRTRGNGRGCVSLRPKYARRQGAAHP